MSFTSDKKEMGRNIFLSRINGYAVSENGFHMRGIAIPKKMLKQFIEKKSILEKNKTSHFCMYDLKLSYDDYLKIRNSKYYQHPEYYQ